MTFSIPAHKCGLVIGRGGENVKSINQQTGAFVEISRQPPPNGDPNFKLFIIRGSPQQIDHAKQLIEEKIEVGSLVEQRRTAQIKCLSKENTPESEFEWLLPVLCFSSRLRCVQWEVVLVQEAQVVQWVPIIPTLIIQVLLVVLHPSVSSNWKPESKPRPLQSTCRK